MTSPEFRQDKMDLAISQTRSAIARRNDDASGIPDRELMRHHLWPDDALRLAGGI